MEPNSFWNAYHFRSPVTIHFSFFFFFRGFTIREHNRQYAIRINKTETDQLNGKIHLSHPGSNKKITVHLASTPNGVQGHSSSSSHHFSRTWKFTVQISKHPMCTAKSQKVDDLRILSENRKKNTAFWPLKSLLKGASHSRHWCQKQDNKNSNSSTVISYF